MYNLQNYMKFLRLKDLQTTEMKLSVRNLVVSKQKAIDFTEKFN